MSAVVPDTGTSATGTAGPGLGVDTSAADPSGTVPDALDALRAGRPVLVADGRERENEVDVVLSAAWADQRWLAWTIRHTSGYLCAPMPADRADALGLPLMWPHSQDPRRTAYTVAVDAHGVGTGISAADRALTLRTLADPATVATDLMRPGHVLPLRARPGGVRERQGHTEAAVELMRLAGPRAGTEGVAAIAELVTDDGDMVRYDGAARLAVDEDLVLITVAQLVEYVNEVEDAGTSAPPTVHVDRPGAPQAGPAGDAGRVEKVASARLPTRFGEFEVTAYRDRVSGAEHLALVSGDRPRHAARDDDGAASLPGLVRVHSECLTGDALGSARCDCGPQLVESLAQVAAAAHEGRAGAVVYLRGHEGRGIGLADKIAAYALQDGGLDTVDANEHLGLPVDAREYGAAAAILRDLGLTRVELLTNNPAKRDGLTGAGPGVEVVGLRPLYVGAGPDNERYLATKQARMGHLLEVAR